MPESLSRHSSEGGRYSVEITPAAMRAMLAACRRSGRKETGGILIGKYTEDNRVAVVISASCPASDTRAGRTWLVRGVVGLHTWLDRLWKFDEGYYLGEWHYHPFSDPKPSWQDVKQMRRIASDAAYQCAEPVLVIVGGDPNGVWSTHIEVNSRDGGRFPLKPRSVIE